jgi:hypothetical protein
MTTIQNDFEVREITAEMKESGVVGKYFVTYTKCTENPPILSTHETVEEAQNTIDSLSE